MILLLLLFWVILNGKVTVEVIVVGAAVSAALTWFARKILHSSPRTERLFLRRLPGVFCYLFYLAGQVVISNIQVISLIFDPGRERPKLVWFRPPVEGKLSRLALANSITLTPGTVTASLGEDAICVYVLRPRLASGLKESGFVKRLKKWEERDHG